MAKPTFPPAWQRLRAENKRARQRPAALSARVRASNGCVDPVQSAKVAGLRYVNDRATPGIRRCGRPNRFRYRTPDGRPLASLVEHRRIRSLAIPPAWTDVWICPDALGHLQATGRDRRGRKQYRYHTRWREARDEVKYGRLIAFARALPLVRRRTLNDLKSPGLTRRRVVAAVVQLLEKTLIRVGNEEYARENSSYGLTTMRDQHAKVSGPRVQFTFRGKSGTHHAVDLRDARLARIVRACRDLPGFELFQYVDQNGRRQTVDSADVNAYVREVTGQDFTAKDFRTWAGTVIAARALAGVARYDSMAEARRNVTGAIEQVARRLGNTKAVSRKCYIHPSILEAYLDGVTMAPSVARGSRSQTTLTADERAVVLLLRNRARRKTASSVSSGATVTRRRSVEHRLRKTA